MAVTVTQPSRVNLKSKPFSNFLSNFISSSLERRRFHFPANFLQRQSAKRSTLALKADCAYVSPSRVNKHAVQCPLLERSRALVHSPTESSWQYPRSIRRHHLWAHEFCPFHGFSMPSHVIGHGGPAQCTVHSSTSTRVLEGELLLAPRLALICHLASASSNSKLEARDSQSAHLLEKSLKTTLYRKSKKLALSQQQIIQGRISVQGRQSTVSFRDGASKGQGVNSNDLIANLCYLICARDNVWESKLGVVGEMINLRLDLMDYWSTTVNSC